MMIPAFRCKLKGRELLLRCPTAEDLRCQKLQEPLYPTSLLVTATVMNHREIKEKALAQAIPEFLRHNIVENDVRNII